MKSSAPHPTENLRRKHLFTIVGVVVYILFMATLLFLLGSARRSVLKDTNPAEAAQAWQEWVEDVKQQAETSGPVQRREPEAAESPAVLLMRDMFPMCITATIVFGSVIFGSFWWLLRGAIFTGDTPSGHESRPGPDT